jgi:hypothetical protein
MTVDEFTNKVESNLKRVAIWTRVGTGTQEKVSIPTQIHLCTAEIEKKGGCLIKYVFQETFCSLDLYASEKFFLLHKLIKQKQIDIVIFLDLDRIEGLGEQRIIFLEDCIENGVEAMVVHGKLPDVTTIEGKRDIFEKGLAKEWQVSRARQGAKEGLNERITEMGLPASYKPLDGFKWLKPDLNADPPILYPRLVHNPLRYPTVEFCANMLKESKTETDIMREAKAKGYRSAKGKELSGKAISNYVYNPAYAGRYYGGKTKAVKEPPKKGTIVKSTKAKPQKIPIENQTYQPKITVESPPFTWEERARILKQFDGHTKNSCRNSKRDYLLKGFIFSGDARDSKGKLQLYHARTIKGKTQYRCPKFTPVNRTLPAEVEPYVKQEVLRMVTELKKKSNKPTKAVNLDTVFAKELSKISDQQLVIRNRLKRAWEEKTDAETSGKTFDKELYNIITADNTHKLDELNASEEKIKLQRKELADKDMIAAEMITFFEKFGVINAKSKPTDREWNELFHAVDLRVIVNSEQYRKAVIKSLHLNLKKKTFCGIADLTIEVGVPVEEIVWLSSAHAVFHDLENKSIPQRGLELARLTRSLPPETIEKLDSVDAMSIAETLPKYR